MILNYRPFDCHAMSNMYTCNYYIYSRCFDIYKASGFRVKISYEGMSVFDNRGIVINL